MALALVLTCASILITLIIFSRRILLKSKPDGIGLGSRAIIHLNGLSLYHSYEFISSRYGFMQSAFKTGPIFQFWFTGNRRVIGLSGDVARKFFFLQKDLKFDEAYAELNFPSPETPSLEENEANYPSASASATSDEEFARRLQLLMSNSRISAILPALLKDIRSQMVNLGRQGTFDPFNEVYGTVFRMTTRMAACRSLAENEHELGRLGQLYVELNDTCKPFGVIAPSLPIFGGKRRIQLAQEMSDIVRRHVVERSTSDSLGEDTIDILLRDGMDLDAIVNFVMRLIFGGTVNTGMNACWVLLYLAKNPAWKNRVCSEILHVISRYTDLPETSPLHERLTFVPMNAWENEMPLLDLVCKETLRLTMAHMTGLRKIEHRDVSLGDLVFQKNSFFAYSFADAHLDSKIYTDPLKFDPDRFSPSRSEEKKGSVAYLSWGAGRHPCPGSRVAKLELRIIAAYMLTGYNIELVDGKGAPFTHDLELDYNTLTVVRPTRAVFVRYKENPAVTL